MIRLTGLAKWRAAFGFGGTPEGRVPEPPAALGFIALVAVLFFYGAIQLQGALGEYGVLAAEWLLLFIPALLFVVIGRYDAKRTLSLRLPTSRALFGATLLAMGALPLIWLVGWLQTFVLPVPREVLEGLQELMTAESLARGAWLLLVLAVTPAFCEEIIFRGVLLGSTKTLGPWRLVVLNGLVFGAFHLSFQTVIRFLPTALLGGLIAWVVWRTKSIWVGVLMHFLNNATIIALTSWENTRESFSDPEMAPPVWLVLASVVTVGFGIRSFQGSEEL